jgi:small-conductance mechanosensitive channel
MTGSLLLLVMGAAFFGWWRTRDTGQTAPAPVFSFRRSKKAAAAPPPRERKVDEQPVVIAQKLAATVTKPEELPYSRQALRLANHEVDLAFADAIRELVMNPPALTDEAKELAEVKARAQAEVEVDQQLIKRLTASLASPGLREQERDALENQMDAAKAELELDKDELDAASDDLERAGGDPQARIQRLKAAHEATQNGGTAGTEAAAPSGFVPKAGSLLAFYKEWRRIKSQIAQLNEARKFALDKVQRLTKRRAKVQERLGKEKDERQDAKQKAWDLAKGQAGPVSRSEAKAAVGDLKRHIAGQRTVADMGRRIQDEQELAEVYEDWATLQAGRERTALHHVLARLLWVLGVLIAVYILDRFIEHYFFRHAIEKARATALATVIKLASQFLGLLGIVIICFGVPGQITTILGLAGAGLTVALKDFIVAFFGWFVLMGRNGIRVGDWVEIKGVGGEVIEVGLLRTVLLETGSWTDSGHPTGRRVAFVNSFAIEGHYFNFSTSGRWMWDELNIAVPLGEDPYPVIDGVRKLVEQETEANARVAEQEWRKTTSRYRVQAFSAVPGINVVPTSTGIQIHVRYITRANERHETRKKLYGAVVDLMHGKDAPAAE